MNGVVIVGSDPGFIKNKFTPKLGKHGVAVLDHWGWQEKNPRALPERAQAVIIMSSETGSHLVRAAKKAAKDRGIPVAEVPRQMGKALPQLERIGLVTDTTVAVTGTTSNSTQAGATREDIILAIARRVFMQDGHHSMYELTKRVTKLNPSVGSREADALVKSGIAMYKQSFAPAVEWVELYLSDNVGLTDAALIRSLKSDHSFNLEEADYKDVVARGRRKVFGHISIPEYPDEAWAKYVRPKLLTRKIVEAENAIKAAGDTLIEDLVDYVSATDTLHGDAPKPIASVEAFLGQFNGNPLGLSLTVLQAIQKANSKIRILQGTLNAMYVRAFGKKLDTNMANGAAWYLGYTFRDRSEMPHITKEEFTNLEAINNIIDACEDKGERFRMAERFDNIRAYLDVETPEPEASEQDTKKADPEPEASTAEPEDSRVSDTGDLVGALRGMDPDVLLDAVARITGDDLRETVAGLRAQIAGLQAEYNKKIGQFHSMRARVGALTQSTRRLREEREALTEQVEGLQDQLERRDRQIAGLQGDLHDAQRAANEKGNAFVADLEAKIQRLEDENGTLRDLLGEAENTTPKTPLGTVPATATGNEVTLRELIGKGYGIKLTPPNG